MGKVYFTSNRELRRAENLHAVYDAWTAGNRYYVKLGTSEARRIFREASKEDIIVTDEFIEDFTRAVTIMISHGMPGGKWYGLDQRRRWHDKDRAPTFAITASEDTISLMSGCTGTPIERVLPLGFPRTDAYIGKKKGDGDSGFSHFRKVYLYAPTFRNIFNGVWHEPDYNKLGEMLEDDEVFIVKRHMLDHVKTVPDISYHVVGIDANEISTPYLIDCDVLITDYSSILFDAHILGKPVVLYDPDRLEYLKTRGMYRDYPWGYASRETQNWDKLLDICRKADKPGKQDELCKTQVASMCDGQSTFRVIQLIEKIQREGVNYDSK